MAIELTPTQHQILQRAITTSEGRLDWFPDTLKGGARNKVLHALLKRGLIAQQGTDWLVTPEGCEAVGAPRFGPAPLEAASEAAVASVEASVAHAPAGAQPRTRDNSKQARVLAMLRRSEGATIRQIMEATGWQSHTVRGAFAGAFKKKLGLHITSDKSAGGQRVYRIGS